ncbi:MAG TPA: hypothetical protein VM327_05550 [Candidatus Thermoplasmatota archaeon]|nr:hypothetical protein [Candidatus Thermoplasmatota archaeon]
MQFLFLAECLRRGIYVPEATTTVYSDQDTEGHHLQVAEPLLQSEWTGDRQIVGLAHALADDGFLEYFEDDFRLACQSVVLAEANRRSIKLPREVSTVWVPVPDPESFLRALGVPPGGALADD